MIKKIIGFLLFLLLLLTPTANAASFSKQKVFIYDVFIIEVQKEDKVELVLANSDKLAGAKTIKALARERQALGGINGGFFKVDSLLPLGILFKNDKLYTGTLYDRSALIKYKDGKYEIKRLHFKGYFKNDQIQITVDSYNQPRLSKNQVIIYDKQWTKYTSNIFKNGYFLVIEGNKVTAIFEEGANTPIDGFVVYGPKEKLKDFKIGDTVNFSYTISNLDLTSIDFILGAGPSLIENYSIIDNIQEEKFSCRSVCYLARRSAVAIKDGKLYLIVTPNYISLEIFSKILKELNFEYANNLDGGSSSQLYWGDSNYIYGQAVNNGLLIF